MLQCLLRIQSSVCPLISMLALAFRYDSSQSVGLEDDDGAARRCGIMSKCHYSQTRVSIYRIMLWLVNDILYVDDISSVVCCAFRGGRSTGERRFSPAISCFAQLESFNSAHTTHSSSNIGTQALRHFRHWSAANGDVQSAELQHR
jgi:hypothetical protein